jgi:hypothetical protein
LLRRVVHSHSRATAFRVPGSSARPPDSGLVFLDSLSELRHDGWKVGKRTFRIQAYAELNRSSHNQVRQAIFADVGVGIGVSLPLCAQDEVQPGQPLAMTSGPRLLGWSLRLRLRIHAQGPRVRHLVAVSSRMTWAWFDKYCDEAYAIFDAKNTFKKSIIDKTKLKALLKAVSAA